MVHVIFITFMTYRAASEPGIEGNEPQSARCSDIVPAGADSQPRHDSIPLLSVVLSVKKSPCMRRAGVAEPFLGGLDPAD